MINKLRFNDTCIEIVCDRTDAETTAKCSKYFPLHRNRISTSFKMSLRNAPEVLQDFRGITQDNLDKAPKAIQKYYEEEMRRRSVLPNLLEYGPTGNPVVTEHLTLERHQQLGREIAQVCDRFGFFYDTRTGKTPLSLAIIYDSLKENPKRKWLVVCPLILIENAWIPDAKKFIPSVDIVSCHASTKAKRLKAMQTNASIYVTNVESFASYKEYFESMQFYGCIVDESSTMKSPKSKQSQALVEFSQTVKRWYLLTGTPAPNGEHEYYMQLRSIDYYCVQQSYSQFKEYFFLNTSYNPQFENLVTRPDTGPVLQNILKEYSLYVDKEDVLETPGREFHTVEYELDEQSNAQYKKMKKDLFIELQDSLCITAKSTATKLNKLNQITSGFIFDTDAVAYNKYHEDQKQEVYELSRQRFDVLQEVLNKHPGEQVLIWANYRWEFDVLKEMLGNNCRCVYGGTKIEEKIENIQMFKSGKVQYLCANPASADKGLTLTNAHIAIYFSLNWSYELFKQSMERIYGGKRIQPIKCDYYVLLAKGTIDGVLYHDVLSGKADASMAVLNHLKGGL